MLYCEAIQTCFILEPIMKRIIRNGLLFLDLPQGDILSAGFIIMGLSMLSGVFGLVRDRLLAGSFTPDLVGIYFASFVIPDNIFQIIVLSATGAAFIPVFTKYKREGSQWEFVNALFHLSLALFLFIMFLVFIFVEPLSSILVPGIQKEDPRHIDLLVNLTRIILAGQVFFVFSYLSTGILQSYHRFIIPALGSVFYNLGIICGILFLAPAFGMYGVAIGIIFGALLHFIIQLPSLIRVGFSYRFPANLFHPGVKEIAHLMVPRALSIAIERLKFTIDTVLASLISLASITYFNFALHVAVFPVSLIAAAIAQAALPFFAKSLAEGNHEEFRKHLMLSLTHILFLLAPFSVLLIVFHTPVVRLVFGGPLFSWEATVLTARTLAILCIALIAQGASNVLARAFYALLDTKTPLIMTLISTAISIVLSIIFVFFLSLDVRFLAVSTALGAFINASTLFILLEKKIGGLISSAFLKTMSKIFAISVVVGILAYAMLKLLEKYFNTIYTVELLLFTLLVTLISVVLYVFLSFVLDLEEYKELFVLFKKAANVRKRFVKEVLVDESP